MLTRVPISNPRTTTTVVPSWRWTGDPKHEHAIKYPRRLDRGARVPVNGFRQIMPTGRPGGVPYGPPPLDWGLHKTPMVKASPGLAARHRAAMEQELWALTARTLRREVKIKEGLSALDVARLPRNLNRGWIGRSSQPIQRGLIALHMQVPSDKLEKFAVSRIGVQLRRPEIIGNDAPRVRPIPQVLREIVADPQGFRSGNQGRTGKPAFVFGNEMRANRIEVERRIAGPTTAPPSRGPSPVTRNVYGGWGRPVLGRMGGSVSPIRDSVSVSTIGQRLAVPVPASAPNAPGATFGTKPLSGWIRGLLGR